MSKSPKLILLALPALIATDMYADEPVDSIMLQEVVVSAPGSVTRLEGSTLISTIAGTPLQNLGTCLDLLGQLPMLKVEDGAVSVTGKGAPEIYIDGRPMRDDDELVQLRSDNISKVELLLAPGAQYSGETRAVLRIKTRRNFVSGLSVTDRAELSVRRRVSANDMLDLNYRTGEWDIFATATAAHNNSLTTGTTTNTLIYEGRETIVGSSQHNTYPSDNGTIKAGFNRSAGDGAFGAYYRYNPERGEFLNSGTEWLDAGPRIGREINNHVRSHSHLVSAYWEDRFADKYLVHFDGAFRTSLSRTHIETSYPDGGHGDVDSRDRRRSTLWAGKLYTTFPLFKGELTTGIQDSHTRTTLDYRMETPEVAGYIPSTFTEATQTSAALFASWSRSFGPMSLSAGLRYEYVDYRFCHDGAKDTDMSRRDNLLTPDLSFGWNFKNGSQLNLSYRMVTQRPPYSQLTRSLGYVGSHEIEGGNPALRDEHMHDIQLFGMWKDFILQADFTRSLDTYGFVKRLYPADNLQLIMLPMNLNVSSLDCFLVWERAIRSWRPQITLGMHRQWLGIEGKRYDKPIFTYFFDNTLTLPHGWMLTVGAWGQTEGDMHTNRFGTTWFSMDASVSRWFFNKALQIHLSATDIFNTASNDWTMDTYGVKVDKRQRYDRRGVSLSITYRFQPNRDRYRGKSASEAEMKRL